MCIRDSAKTGRPRRVGPIDLVATRYGVEIQGATEIALTKLDVLSYLDRIPVCVRYRLDGQSTESFPFPTALGKALPEIEYLPGWKCEIRGIKEYNKLPENCRKYIEFIEKELDVYKRQPERQKRALILF